MTSLILIVIASVGKSVMDVLQFHYADSCFAKLNQDFWDPDRSWRNKWVEWSFVEDGKHRRVEKFWGSSTVFVFLTDAWHLFQSIFLNCLFLAVIFYQPIVSWWIDFLIYRVVFGLVFELFYSKVLR